MNQYAAYCRVSSEEQQKNETIERQIDLLNDYILRSNIVIPNERWYIDENWSGTLLLRDRPDGSRMLLDAMEGKFTHLLVTHVDRLGREDYAAQEAFHRLKSCGVYLVSITQPFNYFEPSGQMMATVFSTFAAYDRAELVQKFADGKSTHARRGRFPQGPVPFGYNKKDKILAIEPKQAEIIKMIYKLYIGGMSIRAITEYLSNMDIPSPASFKNNWYPNSSGDWCEYTVTKILNSEYYSSGQYPYKPPKQDIIMTPAPPIIDIDIYKKAREIAAGRRQEYAPNGQYREYLLKGLIKCGNCGSTYVGTSNSQGRFSYYRCTKKIKRTDGQHCTNSQINADLIEDLVWKDIKRMFSNPEKLLKEVSQYLTEQVELRADLAMEFKEIDQRLTELQQEKKRLIDLYAKGITTSENDLARALDERENALASLKKRKASLAQQMQIYSQQEETIKSVLDVSEEIKAILDDADERIKRDLFAMLVDHIELVPGEDKAKMPEIRVFYRIGLTTFNDCYLVK